MTQLQQVLQLYMDDSALDGNTIGWAFHDPTDGSGPGIPDRSPASPYPTGLDALRDGWRLLQMSQLLPPALGAEHSVAYLPFEFVFERLVTADPGKDRGEGTR